MKMSEYLKKKSVLLILTLIIIIFIVVFSIITFIGKGDKVQEQPLKVEYNIASLDAPMDREDGGLFASTSTISITNNHKKEAKYKLVAHINDDNTLDLSKVYIKIYADTYILSDVKDNIYESTIEGNSTFDLKIRSWIGSDLITEEDLDKQLSITYEIINE